MERKQNPALEATRWILPLVGLLGAVGIYCCVSGCGFLGILLGAWALIVTVFNLLDLWERRKPAMAKRVRWALRIVLILLLIASTVTLLPVLRGPADAEGSNDYVIVLGAGVRGTEPSEILADRIAMAAAYLRKHPDAICIATGGKGDGENISEAQCIYNHLTRMGVDGSRIWLEDKATSTIENFRYSIAMIEEKTGIIPQSVTVLSSEFHLYRASVMAADCGLEADFVAAPTSSSLSRVSYTLREVFALWKYLIMGG